MKIRNAFKADKELWKTWIPFQKMVFNDFYSATVNYQFAIIALGQDICTDEQWKTICRNMAAEAAVSAKDSLHVLLEVRK